MTAVQQAEREEAIKQFARLDPNRGALTMVERMARAMWNADELTAARLPWERTGELTRQGWVSYALAALDALMEPTEVMMRVACWPYRKDRALHPTHGIEMAGQLPAYDVILCAYKDAILAAREAK